MQLYVIHKVTHYIALQTALSHSVFLIWGIFLDVYSCSMFFIPVLGENAPNIQI